MSEYRSVGRLTCHNYGTSEPRYVGILDTFVGIVERRNFGVSESRAQLVFLQPSLSSASLRVLARGSSVHSLMLSCQHFFGLPRLLPPGTVPCMMVFASPVARVTCPYRLSFLVLTIEIRSSCGPISALTRFLTSSFVILSLNEMPKIFL